MPSEIAQLSSLGEPSRNAAADDLTLFALGRSLSSFHFWHEKLQSDRLANVAFPFIPHIQKLDTFLAIR
mgnify:CR=1 FL=1